MRRLDAGQSIRALRQTDDALRLSHIIEKGFFIDSKKSRPLQLCDVCTLAARKLEEGAIGRTLKAIDESARELLTPLIHRGNESLDDVLNWFIQRRNENE